MIRRRGKSTRKRSPKVRNTLMNPIMDACRATSPAVAHCARRVAVKASAPDPMNPNRKRSRNARTEGS